MKAGLIAYSSTPMTEWVLQHASQVSTLYFSPPLFSKLRNGDAVNTLNLNQSVSVRIHGIRDTH